MSKENTRFITVSILIGIVLTITIGIFALVHSHDTDVERDKYYADHCKQATKTTDKYDIETIKYECAGQ